MAAPPLTCSDCPVMWRAPGEARKATAAAMSSGVPARPVSDSAARAARLSAVRGARSGGYGAAKAALATWSVQLAGELGPRDVTVNVVAPGFTDDTEFFRDRLTADSRAARAAESLTGRAGTPDDIAAAVFFLASSGARHITGQSLHVNGGAATTR